MNADKFQQQILCYSDVLFRMAKSILKDESKSKDAFQDIVLKLWEKRGQLDAISNYRAFSLTVMRNQCLDILRKEQETEELPKHALLAEPDPHQHMENNDTIHAVKKLIDALPELQRTIMRMRDVEELEINEIALIMDMNENAVTVNLSRARKKVREQFLHQQRQEKQQYERYRQHHR